MAKKKLTSSKNSTKIDKTSLLDKINKLRIDEPVVEKIYPPLGKYEKVKEGDKPEKFTEIGKRVEKKEVEFAYYTTENNKGVYYYKVLNK